MKSDLFRLDDQVAVVTGASSGLGIAFAKAMASAGASVVLAARRKDRLESLAAEIEGEYGVGALAASCDVSEEGDIEALAKQTVGHFGKVDVLISNAGISRPIPAEQEPREVFDQILSINLTAVFLGAKHFGAHMLSASKGSIINVASVLGFVGAGQIPQASYTAAKGGVVNMTRELAAQWARRGVRVNGIAPGWFRTEMTDEMFEAESGRQWIRKKTPMGREGSPEELAGAAIFLASDASSYVTGQTIAVDGGWTSV